MALTYKDVADIIRIIDASQCDEVIVELPDAKIVVRRGAGTAPPQAQAQARPLAAIEAKPEAAPAAPVAEADAAAGIVRAPMTGTFYRASSPKDPPFVEVGSAVKKGDTLCIIEVMKLFTSILAEIEGEVTRIYARNAELVQIDQPLFRIEAA
ncbi:MAG: acetyl-CoA carboxylase biotin carboxyl carrier protein [Acidiphilium sp.]